MSGRNTLATAGRVLLQLRRDRRTIVLLIAVPIGLQALMKGVFWDQPHVFQRVGPPLLGIFPLTSMFLVTSITMLRERLTGTLERLLTLPLGRLDILFGYALAFGFLATVQGALASIFAFQVLGLETAGSPLLVLALAVLNALLGTAFGLLVSAFATTEFQAVQFMPAFLFPQMILSGLLVPRERMVPLLEAIARTMPMSYAYDALFRVATRGGFSQHLIADIAVLVCSAVAALVLAAATLRRRTA